MAKPIRTVVVGAGFFGTKRLAACLSLPDVFSISGIIDSSPIQRRRIDETFHIPTFSSFDDVGSSADLAIIATPNALHAPLCVDAMHLGMHVLCEKPLAISTKEARRIVAASKKYKRIVKTGSNHRFFHTIEKAKKLVDDGVIGNVIFFKGSIGTNGERVAHRWFWDPSISGGGTFMDNGCHLLDIARMFMGGFVSVSASMTTSLWRRAPVEDVGSALYLTAEHKQAIITSSWLQWAGYLHIELWGNKGYIIVDSVPYDTVTVGDKNGGVTTHDYSNEQKDSYIRELLYLARCIHEGRQPNPNAQDGAAVIKMVEAAYRSSQKHTWIAIK